MCRVWHTPLLPGTHGEASKSPPRDSLPMGDQARCGFVLKWTNPFRDVPPLRVLVGLLRLFAEVLELNSLHFSQHGFHQQKVSKMPRAKENAERPHVVRRLFFASGCGFVVRSTANAGKINFSHCISPQKNPPRCSLGRSRVQPKR